MRILGLLAESAGPGLETKAPVRCVRGVTGMSGAGIILTSGDVPGGSICTTDEVSALIERLQFDLGEGPCVDAYNQDRPVLEADLAHPTSVRWPLASGNSRWPGSLRRPSQPASTPFTPCPCDCAAP